MMPTGSVIIYLLLPAAGVLLGGVVGALRTLPPLAQSAIQHFAAGVVFAAIATEIVPDVMHGGAPQAALAGFAIGVALMFGLRAVAERLEAAGGERSTYPLGLLAAVGIDCVVDGVVIGAGFATGARQGLLIAVSLSLEMLFLGLTTATTIKGGGGRAPGILAVCAGLGTVLVAAALGGLLLLSGRPAWVLTGFLAFGAAALLYLVTEELLIRAHDLGETPLVTALFFLGFLAVFAAGLIA
ncbi:ZIP family metal transporter [Methylorubrum extorquens]|jgi:zinc transporter, ZIP family|nr:membrane protein [Methylorubrum extorquens]MCP1546737.1 ZIP family zinc transporter [Methylorubrum extorquens]MCP1591941.1 ZIP family zinc transporter [Methylorubrum extorquens]